MYDDTKRFSVLLISQASLKGLMEIVDTFIALIMCWVNNPERKFFIIYFE